MLRLLTLTLLASGVLAQNETTTTTVAPDPNATAATTTTNNPNATNQQQSAAATTTTVTPTNNNNAAATTTQPSSTASGNSTKLAADTATIDSHSVSADTEITVDVACDTCEDGCAANTMVWCKAGYNALETLVKEAATASDMTLGKCDKDGNLLSGAFCAQSSKCGISAAMAAKLKCHLHNPNFGDYYNCEYAATASECTGYQTTLDNDNKVTARRLVARRSLSTISAVYTAKATMRVSKAEATAAVVKTAVNTKVDALTDADMKTKVADAAVAYANTLTANDLPDGTTLTAADLKTATSSANITAKKPAVTVGGGSTAGATSAAISAAAVAAALLF